MTLIREVSIENFKSIRSAKVELGRTDVLIGANGSGKSNVLEAILYSAAASRDRADPEHMVPRGFRATEPRFVRAAFDDADASPLRLEFEADDGWYWRTDQPSSALKPHRIPDFLIDSVKESVRQKMATASEEVKREMEKIVSDPARIKAFVDQALDEHAFDFAIFAPENSALRFFQSETQLLPLGVKGEGLFAHLKQLSAPEHAARFEEIAEHLALLDWFERLEIPKDLAPGERSILIRDRYLREGALFDQRSANEGFLFLLFYLTLFISPLTPSFFAIDNVDTSFNPKLCREVVKLLIRLAEKHGKQVIFTTHNPAVLDALNLNDPEQRLFVVERDDDGATRVRRVDPPRKVEGAREVPLSEAFVRGYLGGLPTNF